jgi:hypothetical protein
MEFLLCSPIEVEVKMDASSELTSAVLEIVPADEITLQEVCLEELEIREENTFCLCNYSA